jgi:hypothetical protein
MLTACRSKLPALYAIPMSAQKHLCESVTNAILVLMVVVVSFAVHQVCYLGLSCIPNDPLTDRSPSTQVYPTRTTVQSAQD